ncbi:putative oxidoreductase [Saccharata proteae CBS 121410]|uniref:Oxidoreductase n=1 Tax=Saccharata proteae CBS 121410 TaxID=1314787 RepID=A0A9P4LVR3_9PEZI|nr:putative oxidoreductase [Saccharata proteae CBS 121410]
MTSPSDTFRKVLITGASGQYGRKATDLLLSQGVSPSSLLLLTRQISKLESYASRGIAIRQGSFDDTVEDLSSAFAGADTLLLISTSRAGARLPQHQTAITAAVRAGITHIVYTSFIGADLAEPAALVVREHRATEAMLRASGVSWTALRDSQYAEAMSDVVAPAAVASGLLACNAGEGKIAFVSRDDCVAAAAAVLANPTPHANKVYNITGPELLSWRDAAALIGEASGVGRAGVRYQPVTDEEQLAIFDALGVPREPIDDYVAPSGHPWNSSDMVSFGKATRLGEMEVISDDVEILTGRKPRSLKEVMFERVTRKETS